MARSLQPDLVVMDIQLPGMDGIEAAGIIKGDGATSHIKVLVLTAYVGKEDRDRILASDCDAYLTKPVNIEEMLETVKNLVCRRLDQ
ncbi:MAG: response regulator [Bacillota bacterium]